jgi:hexosaminidase
VRRIQLLAISLSSALLAIACQPPAPAPAPTPTTRPTVSRPDDTTPRVVPAPASLTLGAGTPYELRRTSVITTDGNPETMAIAELLGAKLRPATGFAIPVGGAGADTALGSIRLSIAAGRTALGEEGYELTATATAVQIVAHRGAGLFRGIQTLRQLLPTDIESDMGVARSVWSFPALTIVDRPRFGWRGAMLDVARHFFTVDEVKQYIDILALYKLNVLHLHLSDDQGWRVEIKSRPTLTSVGSTTQVGGGPGGFFSQADYQEIVRYAQARYITIVPEIDMPGHTNAALVAYPALSCGTRPPAIYTGTEVGFSTFCVDKEETYALIDDIVREIVAITPGQYFHVGGDEVEALTHEQYARFIERVQGIVHRHGKKMIGWEEITKARLAPTTIAQQWKSDSVTAALQYGAKLLMSPAKKAYLDMKYTPATELGLTWAAIIELRDAYEWDPATYMPGVHEQNIVGVEAPMWSETLRNITAVEYLAMPRLPAIAEVAWSPQATRRWEDFRSRLAGHIPRWHFLGINYHRTPQLNP